MSEGNITWDGSHRALLWPVTGQCREKKWMQFAKETLDSDEGISESAYTFLRDLAIDCPELTKLLERVKATDGRFYMTNEVLYY
jgi:hypothetical protein